MRRSWEIVSGPSCHWVTRLLFLTGKGSRFSGDTMWAMIALIVLLLGAFLYLRKQIDKHYEFAKEMFLVSSCLRRISDLLPFPLLLSSDWTWPLA